MMVIIQRVVCFTDDIRLEHCFSDRLLERVQFGDFRALEAVSVSPDALALIVSWVGGHQVVGRRLPETKTGFGQVVHLKEWTLPRLEGHRSF